MITNQLVKRVVLTRQPAAHDSGENDNCATQSGELQVKHNVGARQGLRTAQGGGHNVIVFPHRVSVFVFDVGHVQRQRKRNGAAQTGEPHHKLHLEGNAVAPLEVSQEAATGRRGGRAVEGGGCQNEACSQTQFTAAAAADVAQQQQQQQRQKERQRQHTSTVQCSKRGQAGTRRWPTRQT